MAKVVVLGGGVAGMSAAHELIERGFEVTVYEKNPIPGGKARSFPVPGSGTDGRKDLPAQHGFRFFPWFYKHLPDTMARIRTGSTPAEEGNVLSVHLTARITLDHIGVNARFQGAVPRPNHGSQVPFPEDATLLRDPLSAAQTALVSAIAALGLTLPPASVLPTVHLPTLPQPLTDAEHLATSAASKLGIPVPRAPVLPHLVFPPNLSRLAEPLADVGHVMDSAASELGIGGKTPDTGAATELQGVAGERVRTEGHPGLTVPAHFPISADDVRQAFNFLLQEGSTFNIPQDELLFFIGRLFVLMTSCDERRYAEYENISWWDFVDARNKSPQFQKYLADKLSRNFVAVQPRQISTRTGGYILLQLLYGFAVPGRQVDRVLDGPTNDVWIGPWLDDLKSRGVAFHLNAEVKTMDCVNGTIESVTVIENGVDTVVTADFYVVAVPTEIMQRLLTKNPALIAADPGLAGIQNLQTASMNGLEFYLGEDVPVTPGHVNYLDSAWALTSISPVQFWKEEFHPERFGDGAAHGVLSVIVSDWGTPGSLFNKSASTCTSDEIVQEVWDQLKRHLNRPGAVQLADANRRSVFLDPAVSFSEPAKPSNSEPLLINTVGSWFCRPTAVTRIPNLFLAADYVRTYTDLATMEGANEAARRAVNGILRASGSKEKPCDLFQLEEPPIFEPELVNDRLRFELGQPHRMLADPLGLLPGDSGIPAPANPPCDPPAGTHRGSPGFEM